MSQPRHIYASSITRRTRTWGRRRRRRVYGARLMTLVLTLAAAAAVAGMVLGRALA
jgi:hypothetical protein